MADTAEKKIIPMRLPDLEADRQPGARFVKRAVGVTLTVLALVAAVAIIVSTTVKMDVTVKAAGVLEPVRIYPVRASEGGAIRDVLVNTGDSVKAGAEMIRLDTLALSTELRQLEARYRAAEIDRSRSSSSDPLERRQQSERGDQARARVNAARAAILQRMVEHDLGTNVDSLLRTHVPGRHVVIDQAVSELRGAEADLRLAATQADIVGLSSFDRARLGTEMEQLQAQMSATRARIDRLSVRAPIDGVVLTEQIERLPGAYVTAGQLLLEVANLGNWRVTLVVPERDAHKIEVGDSVKVEVQAFGQDEREQLRGSVVHVASEPISQEGGAGGGASAAVASMPGAAGMYRVVAELDRAQLAEIGVEKFRRGYTVQGNVITKSGRIIKLLWDHITEKLDR